jgi:enediyne biosynthesis protein E4
MMRVPMMRRKSILILMACGISYFALGSALAQPIQLTDVTDKTGITFVHNDGSYGQRFILEVMSAGLALLDYDQDGDLDIYFLNGAPVNKALPDPPPRDALYRNDGNFRFTDVTAGAGLGDTAMGLGVASADYDNDGYPDLYVNNYGLNVLYHNRGDGTFDSVTELAGVGNGNKVGGGVAFFDKEGDSDLDIYVVNYVKFDPSTHRMHIHKGVPSYPSPLSYEPEADTLFENNGDGTFTDVSTSSGIDKVAGRGMGLVAFDHDNDGDVDVFVANDTQENYLFQNNGQGVFEEVALSSGVAYDSRGRPQASMGVDILDADQDGHMDLFVTAFSEEFAPLYRNLGDGSFEDITLRTGHSTATYPHVTWGIVAEDFDNDGAEDVLVACGDLDDNRSQRGGTATATAFKVEDVLLRGNGKGKLQDLKKSWGTGAAVADSTRGLVAADLDADGRVDVASQNQRSRPTVLRNESQSQHGFLSLHLIGTQSNRDAIGARVIVRQGDYQATKQVICGHSYQSDSGRHLHFGLPSNKKPVSLQIHWPSGKTSEESEIHPDQSLSPKEGSADR